MKTPTEKGMKISTLKKGTGAIKWEPKGEKGREKGGGGGWAKAGLRALSGWFRYGGKGKSCERKERGERWPKI